MDQMRGYIFRLRPTESQERQFRQTYGVRRLIYSRANWQTSDNISLSAEAAS